MYDLQGAGKRTLLTQPKQSFNTGPVLRAILQPLIVEAVCVTARKLSGASRRSRSLTMSFKESFFQC